MGSSGDKDGGVPINGPFHAAPSVGVPWSFHAAFHCRFSPRKKCWPTDPLRARFLHRQPRHPKLIARRSNRDADTNNKAGQHLKAYCSSCNGGADKHQPKGRVRMAFHKITLPQSWSKSSAAAHAPMTKPEKLAIARATQVADSNTRRRRGGCVIAALQLGSIPPTRKNRRRGRRRRRQASL